MKKVFITFFLLFLTEMMLPANNEGGSSGLIAIVLPYYGDNPRWKNDAKKLKEMAEAKGYTVYSSMNTSKYSKDNRYENQEDQSEAISDFLKYPTKMKKVLIVAPIDSVNDKLNLLVKNTKDAKVSVIAYDGIIKGPTACDYFITFNSYKTGMLQGEAIEAELDLEHTSNQKPKKIVLFAGDP